MISAKLTAIAYHLPEQLLDNNEIASVFSGWTPEKVKLKLGIERRHIAAKDETAGDLAFHAAERLFDSGAVKREEIDFILLCTQSPDYFLPTTACILQHRLGIPTTCGALDVNLGCSGYVYSLALCKGLIESGMSKKVLLLTSETYSKYINPNDRASRPLFGDGATASLLVADESVSDGEHWIGPFEFGTNGAGAELLIVPAGGSRMPSSPETKVVIPDAFGGCRSKDELFMHGPGIFAFTIDTIPPLVHAFEQKVRAMGQSVDSYIFHQANRYMLDRLRMMCEIDEARYYNNMNEYGNTVSCSIPIAIADAWQERFITPDSSTMLVGFGVGLSWGVTMLKLDNDFRSIPMTE